MLAIRCRTPNFPFRFPLSRIAQRLRQLNPRAAAKEKSDGSSPPPAPVEVRSSPSCFRPGAAFHANAVVSERHKDPEKLRTDLPFDPKDCGEQPFKHARGL